MRFTARTSTDFLSPVLLNGLVNQYRDELEEILKAEILAVGIDMCQFTRCDNGCQTVHDIENSGIVVYANSTVFKTYNNYLVINYEMFLYIYFSGVSWRECDSSRQMHLPSVCSIEQV